MSLLLSLFNGNDCTSWGLIHAKNNNVNIGAVYCQTTNIKRFFGRW